MRTSFRLALFSLLGVLYLAGCAGPPRLPVPGGPASTAPSYIPITDPQSVITWDRQIDPPSNSTFLKLDGNPYYRIGTGDALELTLSISGIPQTSLLVVDPSGDVHIPDYLGETPIRIAGLAVPQAKERIRDTLSLVLRNPQILLRVQEFNSAFVTLVGEVSTRGADATTGEGRYALEGRTTLLDFLLKHASLTDNSDLTAVIITTSEGKTGVFDISATIYGADTSQNPVLERGDFVTVPSLAITRRRIYVMGEVTHVGMITPRPGMTVIDAIAEVGGLNDRASKTNITLVRGRGDDSIVFSVPFRKIVKRGKTNYDVALEPGDILYVSRSTYNSVSQFTRDVWAFLQAAVVVTVLSDRFQ